MFRPSTTFLSDIAVFAATIVTAFSTLLWLARPEFLPPGSGPDLTHHLLLADYIQQHGTLVHDPNAAAGIGEMAYYTPGLHVLTVVVASLLRVDPFFVVYPLVAFTIALKFGVFALSLLRLLHEHPARVPLTIGGVAGLFCVGVYTLSSVVHDSFLAQAVAELFTVTMWWTLIAWDQRGSWWLLAIYALSGVATFLTWPIWIGPPVLAFALLLMLRNDIDARQRLVAFVVSVVPIGIVTVIHAFGRTTGLGLVATSGAVSVPRISTLGWWMPALAFAALAVSTKTRAARPLWTFTAAIAAQAVALWFVASQHGASTPYMALKMMYLAIYPLMAAFTVAISRAPWQRVSVPAILVAVVVVAARQIVSMPAPRPTVSRDLWSAAVWAREHAQPACADYLVANEYTAYWLHLAVLRNPRSDSRSTDNATYETQASFARWLVDRHGAPYAIARMSVLPREIADRVQVLYRVGDAAVLGRPGDCAATTRGD